MPKIINPKAQDMLNGNAINELFNNEFLSGKKIMVDNNSSEKISEIIQEFAEPLFDECDTDEECEMMIPISIMIWNLCALPKEDRKEEIIKMLDLLAGDDNDMYMYWSGLIKSQMFRKEMYFSQVRRFICDYKIIKNGNELRLTVVSTPVD